MYGDNYLAHYGKKGMKWGVRRNMGQRAREAYRIDKIKKVEDKALAIKEKKLQNLKEWGGDTKKLKWQIQQGQARSNMYLQRYNKLTKDLSAKDLAQGKRGVVGRNIVMGLLAGPLGVLAYEGIMTGKANQRAKNGD